MTAQFATTHFHYCVLGKCQKAFSLNQFSTIGNFTKTDARAHRERVELQKNIQLLYIGGNLKIRNVGVAAGDRNSYGAITVSRKLEKGA